MLAHMMSAARSVHVPGSCGRSGFGFGTATLHAERRNSVLAIPVHQEQDRAHALGPGNFRLNLIVILVGFKDHGNVWLMAC